MTSNQFETEPLNGNEITSRETEHLVYIYIYIYICVCVCVCLCVCVYVYKPTISHEQNLAKFNVFEFRVFFFS